MPMICDFCSAPNPQWVCPCAPYTVPELSAGSDGAWAACDACAELVCHRDWEGLGRRGMQTVSGTMLRSILGPSAALREIMRLHEGYRQHAQGEPYPLVKSG